jgi:hypothetical protein
VVARPAVEMLLAELQTFNEDLDHDGKPRHQLTISESSKASVQDWHPGADLRGECSTLRHSQNRDHGDQINERGSTDLPSKSVRGKKGREKGKLALKGIRRNRH